MATNHGWMNVYRSGWFHREGKPDTLNRHAGDLYTDYDHAIRDIDPVSHYIATVPVQWDEPTVQVENAPDSVPVPLSVSRANHRSLA